MPAGLPKLDGGPSKDEELTDARDYAIDTPELGGPEYSYENLLLCIAQLRQAQLRVKELRDHVESISWGDVEGPVAQ